MDSLDSLPSLSDNFVSGDGELGDDEEDDGINLAALRQLTTEIEGGNPALPPS